MKSKMVSSDSERREMDLEEEEEEDSDGEGDDDIMEELEKDEMVSKKRKFETNGEIGPKNKRKKTLETENVKPPTANELNQLRETSNLFHSNLFRLQIEEMLSEVKLKVKYQTLFQQWFEKLQEFLSQQKGSKEHDLADTSWIKKLKVKVPVCQDPPNDKGIFRFVKPDSVSVSGSYRVQSIVGPSVIVDVNVQIPQKFFQKSDHLNQRYDRKRALYLSLLAIRLQKSDLVEGLSFSQVRGNPLKPTLELQLAGKLGKHLSVRLFLSVLPSTFRLSRFAPNQNNVRPVWFLGDAGKTEDVGTPTAHYNNSVLQDLTCSLNEDFVSRALESRPNVRDAIILLKVWLKQRGLDQGYGCFGGFIMSMYVAYLLDSKRVNHVMSSYQIVRIVWSTLAQSDWVLSGISIAPLGCEPSLEDFHRHFDVVFVDVSGFCNLCADMSRETFYKVRQESELAVKFLDSPNVNSFQALFMTPMPFHLQYDHVICFRDTSALVKAVKQHASVVSRLDYCDHMLHQALKLVLDLLRRGLGSRTSLLDVQTPSPAHWSCDQTPPSVISGSILVGFNLNPESAFSVIDKGPEANLPEAEEFRTFWGKKSELRRFKDGSISEAVVWSKSATLAEKRVVCRRVVQYVLSSHLNLKADSYLYVADQVESLLIQPLINIPNFKFGTGEEITLAVLSSFDDLAKQLRQLKDLPLDVSAVQGTSSVFRYCDVFPPVTTTYWSKKNHSTASSGYCSLLQVNFANIRLPKRIPPVEGIIQLGMSGKWPKDLEAIRRIKAAFNIKIAECLAKQCGVASQPYLDYIDIYKDGYVHRIRVACEREIALKKLKTTPEGLVKYQDTEESLALEEKIVHLPKITSALHGLHQQFQAFGPSCCLAKRWLSAQLMGPPHFPELCTELLVARLFLAPEPYSPPQQPQLGLLGFLRLLAGTDWNCTPIVLNLNGELDREDILEIETRFHSARSALPPLFLATPYERTDSKWTKEAPTLQILIRLGLLATEALKVLEEQLLFHAQPDCLQIFRPSLEAYDVVIHLNRQRNSRSHEAVDMSMGQQTFKPYQHLKGEKIPIVGFDPIQCYLRDLRESYSSFALFFHDCYGGDIICVLWKPVVTEEKNFKVSNINCHKLKGSGPKIVFNVDAALEDFYIIGSGLVTTVETKGNTLKTH